MKKKHIAVMAAAAISLCACQNKGGEATQYIQPAQQEEVVADDHEPTLVPVLRKAQPQAPATTPQPAAKTPQKTKAPSTPAPYTSGKKIYVETDGAQGRVWGYVTMNGDRGSGTIHDWDENTLTVNVTRHGDELFAIDQNSRQYVFKLKRGSANQQL